MASIIPVSQMIQHPDILGAAQQGLKFGQQQRELRETRADQQQLRSLAPGIMRGDPGAFSQAAAIDPAAASKQLAAGDLIARRVEPIIKMIKEAAAVDPQRGQAIYQAYGIPFLRQFSEGQEPYPNLSDAMPHFDQLEARIAMAKAGQSADRPDVKVIGNALVDETGRVIYQGKPESRFFQTDQGLVEVGPGGAREVTLPGQGQVAQPSAPAPSQGMPPPDGGGDMFASLKAQVPGLRVTDEGIRTPEQNAALPNSVPNSYHLTGQAIDIGRPSAEQQAGIQRWAEGNGYEIVRNYADGHWHLEPAPGRAPSAGAPQAQAGGRRLLPASSLYQRQANERADRADVRAEETAERARQAQVRAEQEATQRQRFGTIPPGYRVNSAGTGLEPVPGAPMKSPGAQATEGERKAATLLRRLEGSLEQLETAVGEDPGAASPSVIAELGRSLPLVGDVAANALNSSERQRVEAAQLDILDAALTLGTGAAYTREQLQGYRRAFFPQVGDTADTERDKAQRLQNVIEAARIAAGRAAPQAGAPAAPQPSAGGQNVIRYDAQGNRL